MVSCYVSLALHHTELGNLEYWRREKLKNVYLFGIVESNVTYGDQSSTVKTIYIPFKHAEVSI